MGGAYELPCARSMGKRKKQRAVRRHRRSEQRKQQRRAEARALLVYEPTTPPAEAATIIREAFGDDPVDLGVVPMIASRGGTARARAIADAALRQDRGPMALSVAADVALLEGRDAEAERHVVQALDLSDDPDLYLRLAAIKSGRGDRAAALDVLDAQLSANPSLERLQFARADLLREVHERADATPAERRALDRFLDRTAFAELQTAVSRFVEGSEDRRRMFADGMLAWVETGAVSENELNEWTERASADPMSRESARLRLMGEWTWQMPLQDDGSALLQAFAADERQPEELRRRAEAWWVWATWGLWEVARPDEQPGTAMTDLITGVEVHADVPLPLVAGLPRWSVLLGYVAPVGGVWRSGADFEVASPIEARELVHELVDRLLANPDLFGKEGRPMAAWARRTHDELGPLWRPEPIESAEAHATLHFTTRMLAPTLAGALRVMRGTVEVARSWSALELDDPDAAWRELEDQPGFEVDLDELVWVAPGEGAGPRAFLTRDIDGDIMVDAEPEELAELRALLSALGHPVHAVYEPDDDERPEPPVALPDLPAAGIAGWLAAWPDEPQEILGGFTPREAVRRHSAGPAVEMLIRYLEHDADQRGLPDLDTGALRRELGLSDELE